MDTLKEAMGWPEAGSGLLTSGGSVANLVGIAAARDGAAPERELRATGLREHPGQLVLYASDAVHNSVDRAASLLGIGSAHLRKIPVDEECRIDLAALSAAVEEDRAGGRCPFCVVATVGTVDQGAIDPVDSLADFCAREGLWLHVDGAFGAAVAFSDELGSLVAGIERADSLAFDLHKWMHVPIEAGCVLVRESEDHRRPFTAPASYLAVLDRGITPGGPWLAEFGPQLTRGFRALKCWFGLQVDGTEKLGRLVEQNVAQARELENLIRGHPRLELLAHGPLVVLCFRYRPDEGAGAWDAERLDRFNSELLADLQESGVAAVSSTRVDGRFALRLAITNHRTRPEDLALFVDEVVGLGERRAGADRHWPGGAPPVDGSPAGDPP
ncbi:MAG: hypothetical protein GWM92_09350 [Gemmatimonadetes bacterium]|nr:hypothetical protein [Gemmatimonadota bacterium]NIR78862.1 hypothetical protein [Gemmatimonadota bacterium]NIT87501.1 hypothetical protein [Gemmatimonadota bacterium]NIU31370.1 hypothetical protein [Gemmatimonadota bacterium]NIU36047.1 hypothetical protein [Gemmatimonadota bacterium]